jgi:hypothetical protein
LAALKSATTPELRTQWRAHSGTEPPPYNRRFLESRLAYRVQELAWGGLKPETVKRLDALAEALDGKTKKGAKAAGARPIVGTKLIREWKGVEHVVTVTTDGFEYAGRPYRSLSAAARAITGTQWNGLVFFGLKGGATRR